MKHFVCLFINKHHLCYITIFIHIILINHNIYIIYIVNNIMEKANKVKFMKLSDYELGETLGTGTINISFVLTL